jgi:hypothetical protein
LDKEQIAAMRAEQLKSQLAEASRSLDEACSQVENRSCQIAKRIRHYQARRAKLSKRMSECEVNEDRIKVLLRAVKELASQDLITWEDSSMSSI